MDDCPLVWTQTGAVLNLFEESQEPWNASALKRRREQAAATAGGQKDSKKVKFTKMDFCALVIEKEIRTPAGLLSYVQQHGTTEMQAFASRAQRRLRDYIEDAWDWNNAQSKSAQEEQSDWSLLLALADRRCRCIGPCQWSVAARAFFQRNACSINEHPCTLR